MKIGVLSDTHIPGIYRCLPEEVLKAFEECDQIIHAGDFDAYETLEELRSRWPTTGVLGNMDNFPGSSELDEFKTLEVGPFKIGVTHGSGPRAGLPRRVLNHWRESQPGVDLIIFGHSHDAGIHQLDGQKLLNPGSPTDVLIERRTIAILTLEDEIKIELLELPPL